jgi:hypothetical protein
MKRFFFTLGLSVCFASSAWAGGYRAHIVHRYPYSFVPTQQFFYFVGQPIRVSALVEAEKRADPDYQRFLQFKQYAAGVVAHDRSPTRPAGPSATLSRRCGACHSGAAPEAGLTLDGRQALRPEQITAAQRQVLQRAMPPGEPLSNEETHAVLIELLGLENPK